MDFSMANIGGKPLKLELPSWISVRKRSEYSLSITNFSENNVSKFGMDGSMRDISKKQF
jgi:hypothetical protein